MQYSAIAAALLLGLLTISGGIVAAQSSYEVSVSDSTDVPDRTVTVDGEDFTISAIAQRTKGESIEATVNGPDENYDVNFYDSNEEVIQSRGGRSGTAEVTFSTDCSKCDPGTYFIAPYDSTFKQVFPIVISGYDVALDIPNAAESGETITAEVTLTPTELQDAPDSVDIVIGNGQETIRTTADQDSEWEYSADISLDGLEAHEYRAHAAALGGETAGGEPEILAYSSPQTVQVSESSDGGSSGGTGDGGTGNAPPGDESTTTPTVTQSPTPTTSGTATATDANDDTVTPTDSEEATSAPTASETDESGVITPAETTESTTEDDGPGPSVLLVLGVLGTVALGLRQAAT